MSLAIWSFLALAQVGPAARHSLATTKRGTAARTGTAAVTFWPSYGSGVWRRENASNGERTMVRICIDMLLFSSMAAFVSGIVIVAVNVLS